MTATLHLCDFWAVSTKQSRTTREVKHTNFPSRFPAPVAFFSTTSPFPEGEHRIVYSVCVSESERERERQRGRLKYTRESEREAQREE